MFVVVVVTLAAVDDFDDLDDGTSLYDVEIDDDFWDGGGGGTTLAVGACG